MRGFCETFTFIVAISLGTSKASQGSFFSPFCEDSCNAQEIPLFLKPFEIID